MKLISGISCPNCGYDSSSVLPRPSDAPSPYQDLFQPEQVSAARPQIKTFIDSVRAELYDADARIARLRDALYAAEESRAKAASVLNAHIMLDPPVHSLPPEILSYVFSLTFEKPFRIFKSRMPWLLGQVCRHWRAIARQNAGLWNSFVGEVHSENAFHGPILEEVLKQSGDACLQVSLFNLLPRSASILAQHSPRLSTLQLKCDLDSLRAFEDAPEMSRLTKLCLNASLHSETTFHNDESEPVYLDVASKAPRLTHIALNVSRMIRANISDLICLPWPQITHLDLTLECYKHHHVIDILSQCLNLVSFTYQSDGELNDIPNNDMSSIYVFPHLTFLAVHSSLPILLDMQCPALQTLEIRGFFKASSFIKTAWANFCVFLDKSRCTLQELHLIPADGVPDSRTFSTALQEFLTSVSHVPRLEINLSNNVSSSVEALICREDNVIAFPQLQVLTLKSNASVFLKPGIPTFGGVTSPQCVEDELMRIVEASWWVPEGAARIRKARIELYIKLKYLNYDDFEDPQVKALHEWLKASMLLKRLEVLQDEGLDVSVDLCVSWLYQDMIVKKSIMTCL